MNEKTHCDLLIADASLLLPYMTIGDNLSLVIDKDIITAVLPAAEAQTRYLPKQEINGAGKIWLPGLVDAHMHTGQQLLKGKILDELPMIWTRIMLPFESTLSLEKMQLSAELAALEMIEAGTTGFIDAGSYYMHEAAKVYLKSGLRGALSHSTMDKGDFPASIRQTTEQALSSTDSLYNEFHKQGNLRVFYSLRALMNCSEELITKAAQRAQEHDTFLQAHMNEYAGEVNYTLQNFQLRPFAYLAKLGALSEHFIAAHCLMLSAGERKLLTQHKVKVVHCPFSNCGKGVPDTPALLADNISVALGTDGAAHGGLSLWNEMKIFRSVMNAVWGTKLADPAIMPAKTILKIASSANRLITDNTTQGLQAGAPADIIAVDWQKIHLFASQNRVNTLVECVNAGDVTDSIVAGKILMHNQEIKTLDKEQIIWKAKRFLAAQVCP